MSSSISSPADKERKERRKLLRRYAMVGSPLVFLGAGLVLLGAGPESLRWLPILAGLLINTAGASLALRRYPH